MGSEYKREKKFDTIFLEAHLGDIIGIVGENGSGKSTFMHRVCGLIKENSGTILLNSRKISTHHRITSFFCVNQDVNYQLFSSNVWNECKLTNPLITTRKIETCLKEKHPMSLSGGE